MMNQKNSPEQIVSFFNHFKLKFLACFSSEIQQVKSKNILKEAIWVELRTVLSEFETKLIEIPLDDIMVSEIKHLKSNLKFEIITKNKNRPKDKITSEAINSNFKILEEKINILHANYGGLLLHSTKQSMTKFSDVKVKNVELSLFIILASRYGLISYNDISDTNKADCFSKLTNFSPNSIRNNITGESKTEPNMLDIKQGNLDNLKSVLVNIVKHIDSMSVK